MANIGDRIVMMGKTKNASSRDRNGVIEEVLNADPPRYVIKWDSGGSSVLAPGPGTIRVEPAAAKTTKKPAAKASKAGKRAAKP